MKSVASRVLGFIKKEPVLFAAIILAAVSCFFVPPDSGYAGYIDFRTLAILFCLMSVMAGLSELGVFDILARRLLERVKSLRTMIFILWGLCFVFSMIITNDAALITFVPLTIVILKMLGNEAEERFLVPIVKKDKLIFLVVMQTIAANLGSMLTPIGNPQNLYLYGKSGMGIGEFLLIMLPYSAVAFLLLAAWTLIISRKDKTPLSVNFGEQKELSGKKKLAGYGAVFAICLLTVAHILPYYVTLAITVLYILIFDRNVLKKVDYSLLLTFVGFFIFVGNMGRIEGFKTFLEGIISGNEVLTAVISGQIISNVPAALLLSGFTENFKALIIGTNIGGLGTLIASMASLISYKYINRWRVSVADFEIDSGKDKVTTEVKRPSVQGRYMLCFTAANVIFLAVMLGEFALLNIMATPHN